MDDSKAGLQPGENQGQPWCIVGLRSLGHMGLQPKEPQCTVVSTNTPRGFWRSRAQIGLVGTGQLFKREKWEGGSEVLPGGTCESLSRTLGPAWLPAEVSWPASGFTNRMLTTILFRSGKIDRVKQKDGDIPGRLLNSILRMS